MPIFPIAITLQTPNRPADLPTLQRPTRTRLVARNYVARNNMHMLALLPKEPCNVAQRNAMCQRNAAHPHTPPRAGGGVYFILPTQNLARVLNNCLEFCAGLGDLTWYFSGFGDYLFDVFRVKMVFSKRFTGKTQSQRA